MPLYTTETPTPILKSPTPSSGPSGPSRINRFRGTSQLLNTAPALPIVPRINVTIPTSSSSQPPIDKMTRRSSRPTSPSSPSFGNRLSYAAKQGEASGQAPQTLGTQSGARVITTPPMAHVSTLQSRAPPPPSPYRPTMDRRASTAESGAVTPRAASVNPPRHSSLFALQSTEILARKIYTSETYQDPDVPELHVIPATPQLPDERPQPPTPGPAQTTKKLELAEAIDCDAIQSTTPNTSPTIDMNLEFAPFRAQIDAMFTDPLPLSSAASLPSLVSKSSIPSTESLVSIPASSSNISLQSFADAEAVIGSMLASLSSGEGWPQVEDAADLTNPGLGLGLSFPEPPTISPPSKVAPLRLRRDNSNSSQRGFNHRVAFYGTARAAPGSSPSSGVFTDLPWSDSSGTIESLDLLESEPQSYNDLVGLGLSLGPEGEVKGAKHANPRDSFGHCVRDSISLASECSDEDLNTASIVSLIPVARNKVPGAEHLSGERRGEVGLAF